MMPSRVILVAVTRSGVERACLLRTRLRGGEVYRPARYGPARHTWEHVYTGPLAEQVGPLFASCDQLVFFLAVGAVTRLLAPCLASKKSDPGVLAVDEAGRFVIPVLSGHQGGANAFARTVAGCLGATPVITTASDALAGQSLDVLAERLGWTPEPAERLKTAALALVDGAPVAIVQQIGSRGSWLSEFSLPETVTFSSPEQLVGQDVQAILWVTDRRVRLPEGVDTERILWYRPRSLVLGVGCERGISRAALEDGLEQMLQTHGFARASIGVLATIDLKKDEPALGELAAAEGWQTIFYSAEELAQVGNIPNPSAVVARCVGTPGAAEPAALLASGAQRLLVEKQVVSSPHAPQRMTFALARLAAFEERSAEQGRVIFLGAGPGDPELMTCKGVAALHQADVVVYAGSLVPEEVLRHAPAGTQMVNSSFLTLEEILEVMLAAVCAGKKVVRVHSGDTSLYSAIGEQIRRLDDAGIEHEVIPGISSFQATAAALQCELTVPEVVQTVILTRAEGLTKMPAGESLDALARHGATLCIFLSARLSERVQEQLLTAYPPDTPVAIAHCISWPEESLIVTTLDRLHEEVRRQQLTRTTLILVGRAVAAGHQRSRLYNAAHSHLFRRRSRDAEGPAT
jgi:precorrin-4 C11-methyltransferase